MPEIVINPDGSLVIPRGTASENQFFLDLLQDMLDSEHKQEVEAFFAFLEQSERLVGDSNLCG